MAFLDKTSLIVDAVITDKGREKLSTNSFTITKFALGDDDIDYSLYNEANTNGPNYYGIAIENMPLLEAFTKGTEALRYKLTTRAIDSNRTPEISAGLPTTISLVGPRDYSLIEPATVNLPTGQTSEEYIFELVGSDVDIDFIIGNYADQQYTVEHRVIIEQIDSVKGMALPRHTMIDFKIDGEVAKPSGMVARITSVFEEGTTHYVTLSGSSEEPKHVIEVRAEGEVYLNSKVGLVRKLMDPREIYPGDGFQVVVNGAGFIQLLVVETEQEKEKEKEKHEKEKNTGEHEDAQFFAPLRKSKAGNTLSELDLSRGMIAEGVALGVLRSNMRVFIEYVGKTDKIQRISATIASINAKRDRIVLAKALSAAVPDLITLIVE
jgi:hypothetical protein